MSYKNGISSEFKEYFSPQYISIMTYLSFSKYHFTHMHNGHLRVTISILFDKRLVGSDAWNDLGPSA